MAQTRFGELLGQMVRLTSHDVEEILQEQSATHRRFGEIALNWGLCQPEHVWNAWISQLARQTQHINLAEFGVDCQALAYLSRDMADDLCIIPVRAWEDCVVLAISDADPQSAIASLPAELRGKAQFVLADAAQIRRAIEASYGVLQLSA